MGTRNQCDHGHQQAAHAKRCLGPFSSRNLFDSVYSLAISIDEDYHLVLCVIERVLIVNTHLISDLFAAEYLRSN